MRVKSDRRQLMIKSGSLASNNAGEPNARCLFLDDFFDPGREPSSGLYTSIRGYYHRRSPSETVLLPLYIGILSLRGEFVNFPYDPNQIIVKDSLTVQTRKESELGHFWSEWPGIAWIEHKATRSGTKYAIHIELIAGPSRSYYDPGRGAGPFPVRIPVSKDLVHICVKFEHSEVDGGRISRFLCIDREGTKPRLCEFDLHWLRFPGKTDLAFLNQELRCFDMQTSLGGPQTEWRMYEGSLSIVGSHVIVRGLISRSKRPD